MPRGAQSECKASSKIVWKSFFVYETFRFHHFSAFLKKSLSNRRRVPECFDEEKAKKRQKQLSEAFSFVERKCLIPFGTNNACCYFIVLLQFTFGVDCFVNDVRCQFSQTTFGENSSPSWTQRAYFSYKLTLSELLNFFSSPQLFSFISPFSRFPFKSHRETKTEVCFISN